SVAPRKRRYLIAPRATAVGLAPMASAGLFNALQTMPDVDIVRTIKPKGLASALAAGASSAPAVLVASMDEARGEFLRLQAQTQGQVIVEPDAALNYGPFRLDMANASAGLSTNTFKVDLKVVGSEGNPIANADVEIYGLGFPSKGLTNSDG